MTDPTHQSAGKPEYRLGVSRQTRVVLEIVDLESLIPFDQEPGETTSIGPFDRSAILDVGTSVWVACSGPRLEENYDILRARLEQLVS